MSDWSSLGSAAPALWGSRRSAAMFLAQKCTICWYDASHGVLGGSILPNETIIFTTCRAQVQTTGAPASTPCADSAASTKRLNATTGSGAHPPTPTGNSVHGRTAVPELWVVRASTEFSAAVMDATL
ncbi:hypothetical protein PG994_006788 [Apiospora phragmitis]|uniref:DUF7735 domain-containing protein n=1 Tax=Apiospora phragmitis TaxID=2905665 RepID=A0ABR1VG41_9PEZI